jgi:hypothetical protein
MTENSWKSISYNSLKHFNNGKITIVVTASSVCPPVKKFECREQWVNKKQTLKNCFGSTPLKY